MHRSVSVAGRSLRPTPSNQIRIRYRFFFFQAEDGIRDIGVTWSSDVCSSDLMALGAQLASVRTMILGQTLKLTLIGVAIGLAGAFVVARFLTSLLFGVGTYDPVIFLEIGRASCRERV